MGHRWKAPPWWIDPKAEPALKPNPGPAAPYAPLFALPHDGDGFGEGWSRPEADFRWSTGSGSLLTLPGLVPRNHALEFDVWPHLQADLKRQLLQVRVNGHIISNTQLLRPGRLRCDAPHGCFQAEGPNLVELRHPEAAAPKAFGVSDDDRILGVAIARLTVLPA